MTTLVVKAETVQSGRNKSLSEYGYRWEIESGYNSIKRFMTATTSKDFGLRFFYFVFAVLLYNIWRLTHCLLKAGVDSEIDHAPVLTAGECVELVVSALNPPD